MPETDIARSLLKLCLFLALGTLSFLLPAHAQAASEIVDRMVQNELNAAKNDHSYWMYKDSNSEKGTTKVEEVIQTPEGWMRRLISVNGKPPSQDEVKKNQEAIQKFLSDPAYRKQEDEKVVQDGKKATDLLSVLPKAFLYKLQGRKGGLILLTFQPNPKFHPPGREAKVFHAMAGTLKVYAKETRLKQLSGRLMQNVDFGGGVLGKLKKGGTFEVDQADVSGGHWEVTKLDVHISGRALFFATIKEQQHELMSDFHEVPAGTSLTRAAEMLNKATPATNSSGK